MLPAPNKRQVWLLFERGIDLREGFAARQNAQKYLDQLAGGAKIAVAHRNLHLLERFEYVFAWVMCRKDCQRSKMCIRQFFGKVNFDVHQDHPWLDKSKAFSLMILVGRLFGHKSAVLKNRIAFYLH